jgi:hypothetical protein
MPLPRFYLLDGAVVIHCLLTIGISTFNEYADISFIPYMEKQLQNGKRVDVVWGKYMPDSIHQCGIWTTIVLMQKTVTVSSPQGFGWTRMLESWISLSCR